MIPQSFINDLRERSDIVDIIGSYVQLKRSGKLMKGLCPFHSEKTPSFTVFPQNSSFYCFGCQTGGSAITFIQKIEQLDFVEAVKWLAARAGLEVPDDGMSDGLSELRRRIKEANREAARYFYRQLYTSAGAQALSYLHERGLTDKTIGHFGLGWSPDSWDNLTKHLQAMGFRNDELEAANLAFKNRSGSMTDRFRNRVMFPIIDLQGSVIGFGGRTMEKEHQGRKYLNTSDTPVYKKSNNLYGLNWAKNSGSESIVVTEGFMDVIAMWQAGITNVVASQGTAFTAEQARLIAKYTRSVVLSQDGDEAGQNAIRRSIPVLRETGIDVRVLQIPGGMDPDEYIKANGADRMKMLIAGSVNDTEFAIAGVQAKYDLLTDDGRVKYLREVCELLARLEPLEREVYAGRVAEQLGIDKSAIMSQLSKAERKQRSAERLDELKRMEASMTGSADRSNPERHKHLRAAKAEEALIGVVVHSPELAKDIAQRLPPQSFVTAMNRRLYSAVLELIENGFEPTMMQLEQQLTPDEIGAAARILNSAPAERALESDIRQYIDIIREEGSRPTGDAITDASDEQLTQYLESLRKRKQ